jgi:hypothetical protein
MSTNYFANRYSEMLRTLNEQRKEPCKQARPSNPYREHLKRCTGDPLSRQALSNAKWIYLEQVRSLCEISPLPVHIRVQRAARAREKVFRYIQGMRRRALITYTGPDVLCPVCGMDVDRKKGSNWYGYCQCHRK